MIEHQVTRNTPEIRSSLGDNPFVGEIRDFSGFTSSSRTPKTQFGDWEITVNAPAKTQKAMIMKLSGSETEEEMLLPHGTKYFVRGIDMENKKIRIEIIPETAKPEVFDRKALEQFQQRWKEVKRHDKNDDTI